MFSFFKQVRKSSRPQCTALVAAAGASSRMGGINKLLEDGWTVAQMNTQTVDVDPRLDGCLHKETLVSFVILEKNQ